MLKKQTDGIGYGWGWYLLIGFMGKMGSAGFYNSPLSIVAGLIIFVYIVYFYFKLRKKYFDAESKMPSFNQKNSSFRAGFFSLLAYIALSSMVLVLDRFLSTR